MKKSAKSSSPLRILIITIFVLICLFYILLFLTHNPGKLWIGEQKHSEAQYRRNLATSSYLQHQSPFAHMQPVGDSDHLEFALSAQAPVTFKQLWSDYPSGNPYDNPAYKEQCAIRLSVAFHCVGIDMKSFSSNLIKPLDGQKSIGRIILNGNITATRANEFGEWLSLHPIAGIGRAENITGKDWESRIKGRTGIVMFDGYRIRGQETAAQASGGHIDLWNGSRLTISSVPDAAVTISRFAFNWQSFVPALGGWSDLRNSKKILFWEVK
jgi:hypothetical protein